MKAYTMTLNVNSTVSKILSKNIKLMLACTAQIWC